MLCVSGSVATGKQRHEVVGEVEPASCYVFGNKAPAVEGAAQWGGTRQSCKLVVGKRLPQILGAYEFSVFFLFFCSLFAMIA